MGTPCRPPGPTLIPLSHLFCSAAVKGQLEKITGELVATAQRM